MWPRPLIRVFLHASMWLIGISLRCLPRDGILLKGVPGKPAPQAHAGTHHAPIVHPMRVAERSENLPHTSLSIYCSRRTYTKGPCTPAAGEGLEDRPDGALQGADEGGALAQVLLPALQGLPGQAHAARGGVQQGDACMAPGCGILCGVGQAQRGRGALWAIIGSHTSTHAGGHMQPTRLDQSHTQAFSEWCKLGSDGVFSEDWFRVHHDV